MTPRFRFDGIYTPVVTPFAADFSVRWDALEAVIDWLIGQGVHGLISGGSTGENYAQTLDERIEIARFTVDKTAGRVPVVIGTGAMLTAESLALAHAAREMGAAAREHVEAHFSRASFGQKLEGHLRAVFGE